VEIQRERKKERKNERKKERKKERNKEREKDVSGRTKYNADNNTTVHFWSEISCILQFN